MEDHPKVNRLAPGPYSLSFSNEELWHYHLGHLSHQRLPTLSKKFPIISCSNNKGIPCDICHFAKKIKNMKSVSHSFIKTNATYAFKLVHFDIWGPFSSTSIHGHKYFLTVLNDYSHFTWIYLLKSKSDVSNKVCDFITFVQVHFNALIKFVRSENGPEF